MKKLLIITVLMCSLLLVACNGSSAGVIGGADGPTSILAAEKNDNIKRTYDVEKYFKEHYVDERKLPILDIHLENPFVSDDRTLILDDSIENSIELMVYEYYQNIMSGSFQAVKDSIVGETLLSATENEERDFNDGIYFSRILIDEIDLVDKDDLDEITNKNKKTIVDLLNDLKMKEFAIVEVEKTVKLNEKYLSMGPQIGDGDITRYYLLGKKDNSYKIIEVYWEGFIND